MKERLFEMECPGCGHSFQIKRDTWLTAGSGRKEMIRSGAWFRHRCSRCSLVFSMVHPFLYRNHAKGYIAVLTPTGSLPEITEEKTVVMARDPDAFCELVRILDNGLQPARIQGIRDALRDKTGRQSLRYETAGQGILWFFDANGSLAVKDPG